MREKIGFGVRFFVDYAQRHLVKQGKSLARNRQGFPQSVLD